jgi:hypothetical protein
LSHLTDHELDQLLQDAMAIDRQMRKRANFFSTVSEPLTPRMQRLLQENRTLRDQAAERDHMAALEGDI